MVQGGQDSHDGSGSETDVAIAEGKPLQSEPPRYAVILHNDDYTTMEFVVEVLRKFFRHSEEKAAQVMLKVHQEGKGVAGIYSYEIAETKATQVRDYAKQRGFPLLCSVEPWTAGGES
jgi:ATP-dependent Clp protease adaptor protein ClpS